jgi:hypothetical protein
MIEDITTMKRKTLGYILLIIGILIAIYGYLNYLATPQIVYNCPANGCNFSPQQLAEIQARQDEAYKPSYIISGVGISISIIGIVILVRSRV